MKKKIVSMLVVGTMVLSILAGCGSRQESSEESHVPSSTGESASKESEASVEKSEEESHEVVTVKWLLPGTPQKDTEMVLEEVNKLLRERYSLELDLEIILGSEYNDRVQLASTANEDFDLVFTCDWRNNYHDNVAKEALLPLSDLLASEAGELLRSVLPEGLTDIAVINGEFYAIPNYQVMYSQRGFMARKDMVEKYNLDVDSVESIKDLETFMEQIRDNETDVWPLYGGSGSNINGLYETSFGDGMASAGIFGLAQVYSDDEDYKVHMFLDMDEVDTNLRLANDYFKRGFIRSDQASMMDETSDRQTGRFVLTACNAVPGYAENQSTGDIEYIMIETGTPRLSYTAGIGTMTGINVNSKNPEAALKMIGVMWTDKEIFNTLLYGLEGEHYTRIDENRVEPVAESGYNISSAAWSMGNQFNSWLVPGQADDLYVISEERNRAASVSHLAGFTMDTTPIETEMAQLRTVVAEYGNGFLWAEDYDQWKADFRKKLETAGINTVIEEVQRQIDEWRVANGK